MSRVSPVKFTYEDYLQLPDDGKRYEIIDGELFVTPAPTMQHQRVLGNLFYLLTSHVRETGAGEVFPAPSVVVLSQTSVVQPDVLYVSKERAQIVGEKYVSAAPDLVVEVLSESTASRDRGIKTKMYELFGAAELWIVDPSDKRIEIFRQEDGRLALHAAFGAAETLRTPTFPSLEVPLSEVF